MPCPIVRMLAALVMVCAPASTVTASQRQARIECGDTQECRRLALDAAGRGAYETFHDLVWRAIQTGRPNDPDLLFLLARAQSLSNRPHDALVVLGRLADMGMAFDALTHEDLERTRRLPGWPALAARLSRLEAKASALESRVTAAEPAPPSAPATAPPVAPEPPPRAAVPSNAAAPPPTAVLKAPLDIAIVPAGEALRFTAPDFIAGGLAYDGVSARFILGNVPARALVVVGEGTSSASDLVRADSTGFEEVGAVEIDRRRGDLWVVSTRTGGTAGVLHKLQLISGRNLAAFDIPAASAPVSLVDAAVSDGGTVLVLDAGGGRILRLRPGAKAVEPVATLDAGGGARSLTTTDDERIAYVAVAAGIARVDVASGTVRPLSAATGLDMERIERLRWHRGSLIAVQGQPDGTRRIIRFRLGRSGQAAVSATVLHSEDAGDAAPTFATVAGDDLYFLEAPASPATATISGTPGDIVVRRLVLR